MLGNGEPKGRGKRVRREKQTRPLIVSAARSRVSERVTMSAPTARELRSYVRWAAKAARIDEDEAQVLTLDHAVTALLKRDELWQAQKGVDTEDDNDERSSAIASAPRPVALSSGSPPKEK
jgi:hypothetical protein